MKTSKMVLKNWNFVFLLEKLKCLDKTKYTLEKNSKEKWVKKTVEEKRKEEEIL